MIEISAQGIRNLREEIISEDYPRDVGDKKAARLINLTLALLATRRFITKEEIFNTLVTNFFELSTIEHPNIRTVNTISNQPNFKY